jgi:predicted nucleotidyltransferase
MKLHHQQTIDRLVEHFKTENNFLALIVGGSVARGLELENSDVDVILVATDEEYERRKAQGDLSFFNSEFCDYPGGYVDYKAVNLPYLRSAALQASEPTRWAFSGAFVAYSKVEGLQELIDKIPVYQENEQAEKIKSYYSQVLLLIYFVKEATKRPNPYLLAYATTSLALFAAKLILVHNKILFPGHKWLMVEVKRAKDKPENFIELIDQLLKEPGVDSAVALKDAVVAYRDWGLTYNQALNRFIEDVEINWHDGRPPITDW